MRLVLTAFFTLGILPVHTVYADDTASASAPIFDVPAKRLLFGISDEDASSMISNLKIEQQKLRAGEFTLMTLLSGADSASREETKLAPRDVFLSVPFDKVWKIERQQTHHLYARIYSLSYAPNGYGKRYLDIEVMTVDGIVEEVAITSKIPAPF